LKTGITKRGLEAEPGIEIEQLWLPIWTCFDRGANKISRCWSATSDLTSLKLLLNLRLLWENVCKMSKDLVQKTISNQDTEHSIPFRWGSQYTGHLQRAFEKRWKKKTLQFPPGRDCSNYAYL